MTNERVALYTITLIVVGVLLYAIKIANELNATLSTINF